MLLRTQPMSKNLNLLAIIFGMLFSFFHVPSHAFNDFNESMVPVLPVDVIRDVILRDADFRTVMRVAHLERRLRGALLGNNAGARRMWMLILLREYEQRFPDSHFVPHFEMGIIHDAGHGTNQFFEAFRDFRINYAEGQIDEAAFRIILLGVHDPDLRFRFIERHVQHVHSAQTAISCWRFARGFAYVAWGVGLLSGAALDTAGGALLPTSNGIIVLTVGILISTVTLGSSVWYLIVRRSADPFEWMAHLIAARSQNSANLRLEEMQEAAHELEAQPHASLFQNAAPGHESL